MQIAKTAFGISAATAAALAIAAILLGNGGHGADAQAVSPNGRNAGLPVPVVAVVKKSVPVYLDYVGTTEAIRSVALQAKVTGYLAARGAADGTDVQQGDLLYRIDPRDYQAALDQAKAQAERDAAARDYARANHHRNAVLAQDGWATKDVFDQTSSALHQSEATLAADDAAIRVAQLNLGYTEIRAPFAGRLSHSLVHEGALISAAGPQLNTLVQLDPIYATFNPGETDLARIEAYRAKGPIAVEVLLSDGSSYRGTLSFIDNAVDRATGTITARATVDNPRRVLLPGQYVQVRLHLTDEEALLVPQVALGSSQLGKFVYVASDGKAEQRYVTPGAAYGDLVAIDKGVKQGEAVIVGNLQKIGPGAPVQAQPAPNQGGA